MNIKQIKNNKLKTILQFSIPSIIAMLLQTVITITDGYFTGNYVGCSSILKPCLSKIMPISLYEYTAFICSPASDASICVFLVSALSYSATKVYELDYPELLKDKAERIKKANLKASAVNVPCDLADPES